MESNGIKGRIHVSEATAEELRRHECDSWLTLREDPIVAKGKGTMTTFFVNIAGAKTSAGTRSRRESIASSLSKMSSDGMEESVTGLGDITENALGDFSENPAITPTRAGLGDISEKAPDAGNSLDSGENLASTPRRVVQSSDNLDVSC